MHKQSVRRGFFIAISEETIDSDSNVVVKYVYTLGASGERLKVEELDRTVEYGYDELYRLTSETITKGKTVTTYAYEYDNVSNRTLKTENGAEIKYVYNTLNQLVSDSETTYEYDLNGNLIRVIGTANSALYAYNAENKLIKATVQNGSLVIEESYTYDYQGNRTSKTTHKSNGEFEYTKYLNDNSSLTNVLVEIDENGTAKCVYTIGADLVSQERDGKVSVYLYDGHGSVVGLANESGVVTDTYSYDAFGNLLKSTGSTANSYRYCGEQFDSTTGLYYLRARYMDTSTGRFISQDTYAGSTADPISLHKYLYANSNPVMYTDPSGYSSDNDLHYYQQAWLTIDQAQDYVRQLACSSNNEIAYNAKVLAIGREIIHQLTMTAIEYALASFLEEFVDPQTAREIANGIVTALDLALSARNKAIDDKLGVANGGTHSVSDLSDSELADLGLIRHPDGSIRDLNGKFAGFSGTVPGTPGVDEVQDYLSGKGYNILGREISVRSTFDGSIRRYDIVIKDKNGNCIGIEVKSGSATRTSSQKNFDESLNQNGGFPTIGKKAEELGIKFIDSVRLYVVGSDGTIKYIK